MAEKTKEQTGATNTRSSTEQPAVPVTQQPPIGQTGHGIPVLAAQSAPPPRGIFDEVRRLESTNTRSTSGGAERHTFGAWCRAKGVRLERVRDLVREGKLDLGNMSGDGPEMSEQEFDRAVDFQISGSFARIPAMQVNVPAPEQSSAAQAGQLPVELTGDTAEAKRQSAEANKRDV